MTNVWNWTRKVAVCVAICGLMANAARPLCAQADSSDDAKSLFRNGYSTPRDSQVVQVLKRIRSGATLNQIKTVLPRNTKYQWVTMSLGGKWKWNTLRFKGKFSGVLVFANDRAKYRVSEVEKRRVAAWRAGDAVHSVDIFLGPSVGDETAQQTTIVTKEKINEIAHILGQRGKRDYSDPAGGPPANGWDATWKLNGGRELYFTQDMSYSESEARPMLQLTFAYSHLYMA